MTETTPIHTADAVTLLLEDVTHLRIGTWIYFQIPLARGATYQGYITDIKFANDFVHSYVTVIPFGEAQKTLDDQINPGLNDLTES